MANALLMCTCLPPPVLSPTSAPISPVGHPAWAPHTSGWQGFEADVHGGVDGEVVGVGSRQGQQVHTPRLHALRRQQAHHMALRRKELFGCSG